MRKRFFPCVLAILFCYSLGIAQKIYTVTGCKDGSLSQIARLNGISLIQLREWNNKYDDLVKVGDRYFVEDPASYIETQNLVDSIDTEMRIIESNKAGIKEAEIIQIENTQNQNYSLNNSKRNYWWLWVCIGMVVGIIGWEILIRKFFIQDRAYHRMSTFTNNNTVELEQLKKDLRKQTRENQKLKKNIAELELANQELLKENIQLENNNSKNTDKRALAENKSVFVKQVEKNNRGVLYADFIDDGCFSHVTESPNDDSNFVLHLSSVKNATFLLYEPAFPRIVRNPAGFLQGCDKQVLGHTGEVEMKEGKAQYDGDGKWKIINKLNVIIK